MGKVRCIVHVDMDAFFASVEQRDNPLLRGRPVVVGADPKKGKGRGVVSTCSYEARKFGIHSAMPISTAYRLCPHAAFLPVAMEKYDRVSEQINDLFNDFTPDIEPVGIDEAFLDITGSFHLFGTPYETCQRIKSRIKDETKLTASVGLAPTKMAAKIASDLEKPDGLVEVKPEGLLDFLWPLQVDRIWGLGTKTKGLLNQMGIMTIGDLARCDIKEISARLGKNGEHFWQLANGIDERKVEAGGEAQSVSNEITFDQDTADKEKIEGALLALSEKVSDRLRQAGIKGRTVTLKIRLEGFRTYTRAATLASATNFAEIIYREIKRLYEAFDIKGKVRLVGVRVSHLLPADVRESLFEEEDDQKREGIHKAIDALKGRFGDSIICRAGSFMSLRLAKSARKR